MLSSNRKCSRSICFACLFRKTGCFACLFRKAGIYFSGTCSWYDPHAASTPCPYERAHGYRLGTHGLDRQRVGKGFGPACRSRSAHIIKFGPVGVESVAEGALQLANRACEILQHDTSLSRLRRGFCRPPPLIGRVNEGPGSKRWPQLNFDGKSLKIGANGLITDRVSRPFGRTSQGTAGIKGGWRGVRLTLPRLVFT